MTLSPSVAPLWNNHTKLYVQNQYELHENKVEIQNESVTNFIIFQTQTLNWMSYYLVILFAVNTQKLNILNY